MIVVEYNGAERFQDLSRGHKYDVLAISIPVRGNTFIRVVDDSDEDYLHPLECFNVVSGQDELLDIVEHNEKCEIAV